MRIISVHKDSYTYQMYIINDYIQCIRGCFHISEIKKICKVNKFENTEKQYILKQWEENKTCNDSECLDELVKSDDDNVRLIVAKIGRPQDLDILVRDKNVFVLVEVAKHGRRKDLNILINNKFVLIKEEIAKLGRPKDLDNLVYDGYPTVRAEVAKHGRYCDIALLINDKNIVVHNEVRKLFGKKPRKIA